MGLFSRATGHLENRIKARLTEAYRRHANAAAKADVRMLQQRGIAPDASTLQGSLARTHRSAWSNTLREVDPRQELQRSVGEEKLIAWLREIVGDYFSGPLSMPSTEAYDFVAEAVREQLRQEAAGAASARP